jgi:hypothetical protein
MLIALLGSLADRFTQSEAEPRPEEAIAGEAAAAIVRAALATAGTTIAIDPALAPLLTAAALDLSPPVAAEELERSHPLSINIIRSDRHADGLDEALEPFLAVIRAIGGGAPMELADALRKASLIFLLGQPPAELPIGAGERLGRVIYFRALVPDPNAESELQNRLAQFADLRPGESLVVLPPFPPPLAGEGREGAFGLAADEGGGLFTAFGVMAEAALDELQPD